MGLIPVHNDVFPSKAFVMQGSGFSVAGDRMAGCGHGGIGKSKKRAVKRIIKKAKPVAKKVARAALDLAEQFGDDKTKQRAQDARMAQMREQLLAQQKAQREENARRIGMHGED